MKPFSATTKPFRAVNENGRKQRSATIDVVGQTVEFGHVHIHRIDLPRVLPCPPRRDAKVPSGSLICFSRLRHRLFSNSLWSAAMQHEQDKADFDTAEVWRNAQQRRADDLGALFGDYFAKRRPEGEAKAADTGPSYTAGQPRPI
jgi:hypothetical protein